MSDDHPTGRPGPRPAARPEAHHPRAEAHARFEGRYTVRVLEPSPPAITSPPFHADDPCSRASDNERLVVSPVATGDLTWSELVAARDDPVLTAWCRDRWLAAWRPLTRPDGWDRTVEDLSLLARHVLGPWRATRTGRAARTDLRWTRGGLGTPFCWDDQQLRLEGRTLVWQRRGEVTAFDPDTLGEACTFARLAGPVDLDPDRPLLLPAIAAVADWLGFATLVAEQVRATLGTSRGRLVFDPADGALQVRVGGVTLRASLAPAQLAVDGRPVATLHELTGGAGAPVADTVDRLHAVLRELGAPAEPTGTDG